MVRRFSHDLDPGELPLDKNGANRIAKPDKHVCRFWVARIKNGDRQ